MVELKKSVIFIMLLVLVFGLAACGNGNQNSSGGVENQNAKVNERENENTALEEPQKVRMYMSDFSQPVPDDMEHEVYKYIGEQTNTKLDIEFFPHSKYIDQLNMRFSSGDIPDAFQDWQLPEPQILQSGMILPLNDLIEKYGPNLKKQISQTAWQSVTVNREIMGVPQVLDGGGNVSAVMYVRKDWMDKLNIDVPETTDEFLDMLRAFRDQDPNGNGKKDEIPYTSRENFTWAWTIFGQYGVESNTQLSWRLLDGKPVPSVIHPDMKKALSLFKTMYEEKLIDPEFFTNSRSVWEQKIRSNQVGAWTHVTDLSPSWKKDLETSIPEGNPEIIAIPTPRPVDHSGPVGSPYQGGKKTWFVLKDSKNPEEVIRIIDWLVSPEGRAFTQMGILGETYTKENGQLNYAAKEDEDQKWRELLFRFHKFDKEISRSLLDEETYQMNMQFNEVSQNEGVPNPVMSLTLPTDNASLSTLFMEAAAKIILGEEPLDYFDEYVVTWKKNDGQEYLDQVNELYIKK